MELKLLKSTKNQLTFYAAVFYANVYGLFKDHLNINIPGLGFLIRNIKYDLILKLNGRDIYFNHKVGGCYGRHFAGEWEEPETHLFLSKVIPNINKNIYFIDIGANIGEMIHDVASYENIEHIYAYEPIDDCVLAINKTCKINNVKNCTVHMKLVGSKVENTEFQISKDISNSSMLNKGGDGKSNSKQREVTTLDNEFKYAMQPTIILLDIEGMELEAMKGGRNFISKNQPLIIFEFNKVSRKQFSIKDIESELGDNYSIFRLRSDGFLDKEFEKTWNCVAMPRDQFFQPIFSSLILNNDHKKLAC